MGMFHEVLELLTREPERPTEIEILDLLEGDRLSEVAIQHRGKGPAGFAENVVEVDIDASRHAGLGLQADSMGHSTSSPRRTVTA